MRKHSTVRGRRRAMLGAVTTTGLVVGALNAIAPDADAQALGAACDLVLNTDSFQLGDNGWENADGHWDSTLTGFNSTGMAFPIPVYLGGAADGADGSNFSTPWIPMSSASNSNAAVSGPGQVICVIGRHAAIVNGTPGNDTIYGGSGNETLNGMGGDDVLVGSVGDDVLIGKSGNDSLYGGDGDDVLFGHVGRNDPDHLGDDTLIGGAGGDLLRGDQGNDLLRGDDGDDCLLGGFGDDEIYGWDGDDTIGAGAGADIVAGNDNNDIILGGKGNDTLRGNDGLDQIWGDSDLYDVGVEISAVPSDARHMPVSPATQVQWAGRLFVTQMSIGTRELLHLNNAALLTYDYPGGTPPAVRVLAASSSFVTSQVIRPPAALEASLVGYGAPPASQAFTQSGAVRGPIVVPGAKIDLIHSSSQAGIRMKIGVLEAYRIVSVVDSVAAQASVVSTSAFVVPSGFGTTDQTVGVTDGAGQAETSVVGLGAFHHIAAINENATISAPHFQRGHLEVAACNLDRPRMIDNVLLPDVEGDFDEQLVGFSGQVVFDGLAQVHMSLILSSSLGDVEVPFLIQDFMTPNGATKPGPSGAFLNWPANWAANGYHDDIRGGDSDDLLYGEAGNDTIRGDQGDDSVWGEGSIAARVLADAAFNVGATKFVLGLEEHYSGAAGDDSLAGNTDDDYLDGGPGNDSISGGPDDDELVDSDDPNYGLDHLDGGDDFDSCNPEAGFVQGCEIVL